MIQPPAMRLPKIKLPVDPLLEQVSREELLEAGIKAHDIRRFKKIGIPFRYADLLAVRLGRHPIEIWGDLWTQEWVDDLAYDVAKNLLAFIRENEPCSLLAVDRNVKGSRLNNRYMLTWLVEVGVLSSEFEETKKHNFRVAKELEEVWKS